MNSPTIVSRRVLPLLHSNFFSKFSPLLLSKKRKVNVGLSRLSTSSSCTLQQKVDVLNMNINYEEIGHGPHVVLCSPGSFGFVEHDFGPLLNLFPADKFTVIVWEPPGYGLSRPPERDFSGGNARFHRDAMYSNELMKTLGFSKYSIIGWSEGGVQALVHAAKFPDFVHKIVSIAAFAHFTARDVKLFEEVQNIDNLPPDMKRPMIQMYGEETFRSMWSTIILAATDIYYTKGGDVCKADLPNVKCPSLLFHGYRDPIIHIGHAEYIHRHVKNSELHIFPKGRHNLHVRFPKEFMEVVLKFLLRE